MAESLAGTWASLAGIEIVNDARTFAYLQNGLGPSSLNIRGDCGCPNLVELLDCPGVTGYVSPEEDEAPWFSADNPASAGFLGFITDEFEGLGSTFDRSVVQAVGNGGILNRSRLGTRELVWRGYLFGATCCSVQYGLRWLTKTLSRFETDCRDCFGDDLELLICCPDSDENITGSGSPFRLLKGVGLLEGPIILSERRTCTSGCSGGCGGSCIIEIEFTLVATQPYFYSPEIPVYDCVSIVDGAVSPFTDAEEPCPPSDCTEQVFIAMACGIVDLPPTATYTNSCFELGFNPLAQYLSFPRSLWNELEEVVPVISISTGILAVDGIQLGFYSSSTDNPCGDLSTFPPDCDVICDELQIIGIPQNSTFYIDGRTRKMAVICEDGTAFAGERLVGGPWSWPSFSKNGFCMEILFDGDHTVFFEPVCISVSLVPRTF